MEPAPPAEAQTYARAHAYVAGRVASALDGVAPEVVTRAVELFQQAPAIFAYGAGRSGIIVRAFAMRLTQIGLTAYVIGESVTPIVRKGDVVVILSGAGESYSSIQTANIVRRVGADLVVLTAHPGSKIAHTATLLVTFQFPEEGDRPRLAPLGTLFEATALAFTDALIAEIMRARGETEESMRRRHAIMV
ncbi:MAG TPA: SIS domain-containing protein [Thermoplasmata archaeon]|nr:SIS domain-containing protein [Thermoplasmata archaeon]